MEEKNLIGHEVMIVSNIIKRHMNSNGAAYNIEEITGMQALIIKYIYYHDSQDVFQRDLEKKFNVRRSTATGILQLMEKRGLIERVSVSHDARLKKLKLTPKAVKCHLVIESEIQEFEKKMKQGLSEDEIELFIKLIRKIRNNIE